MQQSSLDERSNRLDRQLAANPINQSVEILVRESYRRKWQIRALAISLLLDVLLTMGLAALTINTQSISERTARNQNTIVQGCESGNEFRRSEVQLWNHILEIQPIVSNLTPDQQNRRDEVVADFRHYLSTSFAQRDCHNIIKE